MLNVRSFREWLHVSSWFGTFDAVLQGALIDIAAIRRLGAGEFLFQCDDAPDGLYCVAGGTIQIGAISADGREALLAALEPVNWFGKISVFDRQPRTHDARADGRTTLLHMPQAALITLLDGSPALLHTFALLLTHKLRLTFIMLEKTALLPAPVCVTWRLLLMADGYGDLRLDTRRVLHVPQERLVQLPSLSHQAVDRALKDFEARDILKPAYGETKVLDFSRLHQLGYEM